MIKSWIGGNDHEEKNRVSSFRGYLYKLRRSPNMLAPQWGRRWFSIEGHFLRWYRYETDLCAAGMVDLKYVKNIFKTDYMGPTVFTVDCEERTLVLKCATITEMNNWIRAMHKQADIARGGSGTNLVSDFNQSAVDSSSIKYSRKLNTPSNNKSKMSRLEREIEETLKKLEALEQKVDLEDVDTSNLKPTSRESAMKREQETRHRSEEEEMAKIDAEDTMEDSMGDSLTMDVPIRFAKGASSITNTASTTHKTHLQQQQQQQKTPSRSPRDNVDRTNSCSSIEDISLSAAKVKRHREKASKNSSKRLNYGEEPSPPQRHRDIVTGLTLSNNNQDEDFIIIEEYPEEDSVRHSSRSMMGHQLRSNSHNNMTAAQNTRRQFLDSEESNGSSQRRRGSGDNLDLTSNTKSNNNTTRSKFDSYSDDRRSGNGTFNQWQHQQQIIQNQSQNNNHHINSNNTSLSQQPAVRRVSKRYENEDDDDDVSDLLQVRTSKERLPGKFRTSTSSAMSNNTTNSSANNKDKKDVKSVEYSESLEFVEEDAQYDSSVFYGRHGRDAVARTSNPNNSNNNNGYHHNGNGYFGNSKISKSSTNNNSTSNVRTSKQFANLKPAWADS